MHTPSTTSSTRFRLLPRSGLFLLLLLTLLAALLGTFSGLGRVDQMIYDRALSWLERPAQSDIVLITIDDNSIEKLGRWPWNRRVHAALLNQLHKARAVGLDLIFFESDRNDRRADAELARAISQQGHVILPIVLDELNGTNGVQVPIDILTQAAAGLGFINIPLDNDGVLRRTAWQYKIGNTVWLNFALALMQAGGESDAAESFQTQADNADALIPFAGPPSHFRMVSYLDVLEGHIDPNWFQGKYVIVGSWATGLTDAFPTPVSHRASGMAGVEILANLLQSARQDWSLRIASSWQNALASALPVLLMCLMLRYGSPKVSLITNLLMLSAIIPGAVLLLRFGHIWFPPSAALLSLAVCYPAWSWRTQEAILHYVDTELKHLRRNYAPVLNSKHATTLLGQHSLEDRLTQFRKALVLVRNLRQFLTDGMDGIPDATLVFDHEERLQFRNRAAIVFFRILRLRAPHVGQTAKSLFSNAFRGNDAPRQILRAMQEAAHQGPRSGWSADIETRDRHGRDIILKCAPIHTSDGECVGTIITLSNISAIRQAERQREETLRFISHDMRAPQNSILALVAMHQKDPTGIDQKETLARIAQLSHRTLQLVDGFVQFTRAESMAILAVPVDLADMLREVCDEFWATAQARNIIIEINEPLPTAWTLGESTLLRRAISNLLDNAIKYSPAHSHVSCELLAPNETHWRLSIRDTGAGIAPEHLTEVFQPFTRIGASTRTRTSGAGLGLAFVRTVAERHHGHVEVQSIMGQGSTFLLDLPRYDEQMAL